MLNVLFVASEMDPFVKVGGLADVIGSLPKKIKKNDCEIRVIVPLYKAAEKKLRELSIEKKILQHDITVRVNSIDYIFEVNVTDISGIKVYFLQNKELFDRDFVYSTPQGDYADNCVRYGAFCIAALKTSQLINYKPDVIHCHDWHTSFVPIYLKNTKDSIKEFSFFSDTKIVFTIHNIGYQGVYDSYVLDILGFPNYIYSQEGLEYYGKINLMKGGIIYSDLVTTVSPTYSEEIQTSNQGKGLEGVIRHKSERSNKVIGILNGIDYGKWNPETDKLLYENYSYRNFHKKAINKSKLKNQFELNDDVQKPLVGLVCRLAEQKGIDLLVEALDIIVDMGFQVILIGSGEEKYMKMLVQVNEMYKGNVCALVKYNEKIARRIFAASDMFLMPSRYEPCGLSQIIALRYGSIPIVRATGGLIDTISDYSKNKKSGIGFVFENFSIASLLDSLKKALKVYNNEQEWNKLVQRAMKKRFSWTKSSKLYVEEYQKLVDQNGNLN